MNKTVSSLDHEIMLVRAQLHQVKRKRKEASILFTENQANVAERQHFLYERLHRSKDPKINISPDYTHEMKELSKPDDSCRYVMEAEARVCQALHQVEIGVKQHQLLVRQQQRTEKNLKQRIHKEIRNGECMEESLLQAIKNVAIDMACIIVEKESLTNGKRSVAKSRNSHLFHATPPPSSRFRRKYSSRSCSSRPRHGGKSIITKNHPRNPTNSGSFMDSYPSTRVSRINLTA